MRRADRPIANPLVVLREEFDDWAVLFNPDTAEAVGINPIGVVIWKSIDGKRTIPSIAKNITERFRDVPASAVDEISAFIDELGQRGFIGYELEQGGE